jgi:formylglycine-generating enzyme required for sulfatase activity
MVRIDAGEYEVGTTESAITPLSGLPLHRVSVSAYELDATGVTVKDFRTCVATTYCDESGLDSDALCNWKKAERDGHPINCVSFAQAEAYCAWEKKRLPTEVEWEVAARVDQTPCSAIGYGEPVRDHGRRSPSDHLAAAACPAHRSSTRPHRGDRA